MKTPKSNLDSLNSNNEPSTLTLHKLNSLLSLNNKKQPDNVEIIINDTNSFINNFNKPIKPVMKNIHEEMAQKKLNNYRPSILDKLLGNAKIKIEWLNYLVKTARNEDLKEFKLKYNQYLQDLEIWELLRNSSINFKRKNTIFNFSDSENNFPELQNYYYR